MKEGDGERQTDGEREDRKIEREEGIKAVREGGGRTRLTHTDTHAHTHTHTPWTRSSRRRKVGESLNGCEISGPLALYSGPGWGPNEAGFWTVSLGQGP